MMNGEIEGPVPHDPEGVMRAEIGAIERMTELARAQRAAMVRDDLEELDAVGHEMSALLRECARLRRAREAMDASPASEGSRLRATAQTFVDELAINRRVFREAIAGVNERAANLYRPLSAVYLRAGTASAGGVAP